MKNIITPEGFFTGAYFGVAIATFFDGRWELGLIWLALIPIYLLLTGTIKIKWRDK